MSDELHRLIKEAAVKSLFHGSTRRDLADLRANQPNMGDKGLYGADNLDWAALYALAKDRRGMAVVGGKNPKLLINRKNKLAPEGHVYEYAADNPTPPPDSDPNLGWHIPGNVTPLRKHIVKLVDHMKNIEQFDDKKSLQARWKELNNKSAADKQFTANALKSVDSGGNDPAIQRALQFNARGASGPAPSQAFAAGHTPTFATTEQSFQFPKLPQTGNSPVEMADNSRRWLSDNYSGLIGPGKNLSAMYRDIQTQLAAQPNPAAAQEAYKKYTADSANKFLDRNFDTTRRADLWRAYDQQFNYLNARRAAAGDPKYYYLTPAQQQEDITAATQGYTNRDGLAVAPLQKTTPAEFGDTTAANAEIWRFKQPIGVSRRPASYFESGENSPNVNSQNIMTIPEEMPTQSRTRYPAQTPGLVQQHEMTHGMQRRGGEDARLTQGLLKINGGAPADARQQATVALYEPAATIAERMHALDALESTTGQSPNFDVQFSPNVSYPANVLLGQARRHGLISGHRNAQDLLNTSAGQAWLARQHNDGADAAEAERARVAAAQALRERFLQEGMSRQEAEAAAIAELNRSQPPFEKQNSLRNLIKTAANLADGKAERQIDSIEKTAELNPEVQLQPHQERVRKKFEEDNPRMLLYHGLGSGKSLSAIAAAEAAKANSGEDYGIVVPASLRGNFQKELEKFTTESSPEIMSYTGLGLGKKFKEPPKMLIMDEAHRIRNPAGSAAAAARDAAYNADRLLLLTGSPITNSPTDLANLVSLLRRQPISPQDFEKRYIGSRKVYPGIFNYLRGVTPGHEAVIKNEGELRNMLRGHVDYQPSKTPEGVNVNEEQILAPLSPSQQKIQKALRTKIPPKFLWKLDTEFPLSKDELSRLNSFLTGLRQNSISTAPFRQDGDPLKAFQQSGKLQLALKKLRETIDADPRKKAIIYSNHIGAGLDPYAAALAANNIPYGMFHGGVPNRQRQQALKDYNEGKLRALLIGPAGAEGLSTKGTNLIQILDPHWHESRSQQAQGRGLRFDSHDDLPEELKNVHIQRFISKSEDPSFLGKLMGYRRERTGDEILERLSREKEKFNERFRKLLREVGSENHAAYQKQSSVDWLQTAIDAMPMIAVGGLGSLAGSATGSPSAGLWGGAGGAALGSLLAWRNANERNKLRTMAGEPMPDNKSLFDYEIPMSPAVLAALGLGGAGLAYSMKQSAWAKFSAQEKEAGVRFYKRFPINKNMALNLSFGGPSLTLRKLIPGTSLTLGNRAPRLYVGTPIPGLAYQQYLSPKKHKIKAEKDFEDDPSASPDDEVDNRTTWQKVRDFLFGSSYGDEDEK